MLLARPGLDLTDTFTRTSYCLVELLSVASCEFARAKAIALHLTEKKYIAQHLDI